MQAIELTLDKPLYRADKDEIVEEIVCDLISYEDGKMRVMSLPSKKHYIVEKCATRIENNIFFSLDEAKEYQEKLRVNVVQRAINALVRSSRICTEIIQKYGKKQK